MLKVVELLIVVLFFSYIWSNMKYVEPEEHQITVVRGSLVSAREVVDADPDNYKDHYVILELRNSGIVRSLISYDKSLLSTLTVNKPIVAGIFETRNISEVWRLEQNGLSLATIESTSQLRWNLIKNKFYMLCLGFLVFVLAILFGQKSDSDDTWID